jgi:hypothetical protein
VSVDRNLRISGQLFFQEGRRRGGGGENANAAKAFQNQNLDLESLPRKREYQGYNILRSLAVTQVMWQYGLYKAQTKRL